MDEELQLECPVRDAPIILSEDLICFSTKASVGSYFFSELIRAQDLLDRDGFYSLGGGALRKDQDLPLHPRAEAWIVEYRSSMNRQSKEQPSPALEKQTAFLGVYT